LNSIVEKVRDLEKLARVRRDNAIGPRRMKYTGMVEAYAEVVVLLIKDVEEDYESQPSGWGHDDDRRRP